MLEKNRANLYVIFFITALFIMNLLQSASMDLSHDEAYYWVYSLFPAWGYYDHPPMVAWLIWAGTWLGKNELAVRLPFALMQAGSIWILWELANRKNFTVFASSVLCFPLLLASGFLALPDTPLLFFSVLFWWQAADYQRDEKPRHLVILPIVVACMLYSKYHAFLVVLLTAAAIPDVIRRKSFWVIVLGAVVLCLPHVFWQYKNDFISIDFHLNKRAGKNFSPKNIFEYLGGQVALGGFFAFLLGAWLAFKRGFAHRTLFFNSIGFFLFVFFLSLRNRIEANWTVTAFAAFVPLLCNLAAEKKQQKLFLICAMPAILLILALRGALLPSYEKTEPPLERIHEVKNWREKTKRITRLSAAPLFADNYQLASKLSFYGKNFVSALELGSRSSHFSLLKVKPKPEKDDKISYVGDENFKGSYRVEIGYKGPVFVIPEITLEKLLIKYNRTYEEVIRN